jgi:hypothetical protein
MTIEKKFEEIKSIRFFIKNTFKTLTEKHTEIKEQYKTYIEANKKGEHLDSFYFQIKLLDYEYETTNKLYNYIDNRIYCDYYKLFLTIYTFFKLNFKNEKSEIILKNTKYPIYKDLEPYKIYDFDTINDIHQDIIRLIEHINKIIQQNELEIKTHQAKLLSGINIDNYIHNLEYSNNIIVNNVNLYKKSLSSYHNYHISFLTNLNNKLNCMSEQLDNDVNFTHGVKDKPNIVITKICKKCAKNDAEYCEICMYEENEQNNRLNSLRNTIVEPDSPFQHEPIIVPDPEPIPEPILDPVPEPIPEPILDPVPEPIPEPVQEPIIVPEPLLEPVPEPVPEPIIVPEPLLEPIPEPVPEPIHEPVLEPLLEPIPEQIIIPDSVPEPVPEPVYEGLNLYNTILESSINTNELDTIYESNIELEEEPIIVQPTTDITTDHITNTDDIEKKLRMNPPVFDLINLTPKNELTHPPIEINLNSNTDKKKHKKKNKK